MRGVSPLFVSEHLAPVDLHFARLMAELSSPAPCELELAAALVSSLARKGHTCLDLNDPLAALDTGATPDPSGIPDGETWARILAGQPVVGQSGSFRPLILDSGRLYLGRVHRDELVLAEKLVELSKTVRPFDGDISAGLVSRVFGDDGDSLEQKIAAAIALGRSLCVITGGPGTGKTTLVCRILAVLLGLDPSLKVELSAPTGKAARRIAQAIGTVVERLDAPPEVKARMPRKAATLHRLLGHWPGRARNRGDTHVLDADVVVVDEASMADLAIMAALARSLKEGARLILVGDKNQLASVEAGYVLGDICGDVTLPSCPESLDRVAGKEARRGVPAVRKAGVEDSIVELTKTRRFDETSAIFRASDAVRRGDAVSAAEILYGPRGPDADARELPLPDELGESLARAVTEGYSAYLRADDPLERLRLFDAFRVLCAVRKGIYGVEAMNLLVERILARKGFIRIEGAFYEHRPVLVTENDYTVGLFNGDVGVVVKTQAGLRVCFEAPDGSVRLVSPSRLPAHESAYAMTVHKSQGSEFDHVLVVLPDRDSPVLTRELVYTAMTRARRHVSLW
ncbi:MAG TPA: exodeoxyribonuclease V subunit alpha, partial [Deltaproteobacteria bacterium]|nr:exodeoxyribonuclease V subunit alpha [Deltaproteobacteria bacterium]